MKTKMSANWKPSERFYELTEAKGIPREWISHQLPEIKLYWIEAGVKRCWDLTVLNWIKRAWEQVDKSRYYRQEVIKPEYTKQYHNFQSKQPDTTTTVTPLSQPERIAIADKYLQELKI